MSTFTFLGYIYRTNADASHVEGYGAINGSWTRTYSARVRTAALEALAAAPRVTATASREVADFIDPNGTLRAAGLLVVDTMASSS